MDFDAAPVRSTAARPTLSVESGGAGVRVVLGGDWTIRTVGEIEAQVDEAAAGPGRGAAEIDVSAIAQVDTAGAMLIDRLIRATPERSPNLSGLDDRRRVLFGRHGQAGRPAPASRLSRRSRLGGLSWAWWVSR